MKYYPIGTNCVHERRWDVLCEHLGCETPGQRWSIGGHYLDWLCKWSHDTELDSGILIGVTTHHMGMWAGWPSPRAWGAALVKARIVQPLKDVFAAELLRDEAGRELSGYVVIGSDGRPTLETSWHGVQRVNSAQAKRLCLFLADSDRRWTAAAKCGLPIMRMAESGRCPAHWGAQYKVWCEARGWTHEIGGDGSDPPEVTPEPAPEPAFSYVSQRNRKSRDNDSYQRNRLRVVEGRGSAPSPHVREEGKKEKEENGTESRRRGTGAAKTEDLRKAVGDLRHTDILGALRALDGGSAARTVWMHCVVQHPSLVAQVLAELYDQWKTVRNPAGWVMKRLIKVYNHDRDGEQTERITGGGRGGAPARASGGA